MLIKARGKLETKQFEWRSTMSKHKSMQSFRTATLVGEATHDNPSNDNSDNGTHVHTVSPHKAFTVLHRFVYTKGTRLSNRLFCNVTKIVGYLLLKLSVQ